MSVRAPIDKIGGKGIGNAYVCMANHPRFPRGNHAHRLIVVLKAAGTMASRSSVSQASKEARDLVRSAIATTLGKEEFLASTKRAVAVQNLGKYIMLNLPEANLAFASFCDYLVRTLMNNFQIVGRCRSSATKRERLWRAFHKQSVELLLKWNGLYTALNIADMVENLFHQTVNQIVYEKLMKVHFAVDRAPKITAEVHITKDELNALRYASGYLPVKLLKRYEKKGGMERKKMGRKMEQFEMCLGNMAVTNEETDFTQFSCEWFHKVNREGLFPVNDETLTFFIAAEKVTRQLTSTPTTNLTTP